MAVLAVLTLIAVAVPGTASAETEVPPYPEDVNCAQAYLFHEEVGPVTLDGSDACISVIVEDTACHPEELEDPQTPTPEACLADLQSYVEELDPAEETLPPTVCVYPFGC